MRGIAGDDHRRVRSHVRLLVELAHGVEPQPAQRRLPPDRQMAVGMIPVEQLGQRAIREHGWHVAHLHQAIQAQIANPLEVAGLEPWALHHVGEQGQTAFREAAEHRQPEERGVRSDLRFDLCADPPEGLVERQRVEIAAPFVEKVTGERGQTFHATRIRRRAASYKEQRAEQRHRAVFDGPHS